MKKKYNHEELAEIFHKEGKALGSTGIGTLALTSVGDLITISKFNFTFEEMIYLVRYLSQNHPGEFELALKMADFTEENGPGNTTIH